MFRGGVLAENVTRLQMLASTCLSCLKVSVTPRVILIADGTDDFADLDAELARSISQYGDQTLYFWCSDTVMATELTCFRIAKSIWSNQYDCEDKNKQPMIEGAAPRIAHEILAAPRTSRMTVTRTISMI